MEENRISVIVPVYHGKQYLQGIIGQLEACQEALLGSGYFLELLFVNDAPDEVIEEQTSASLSLPGATASISFSWIRTTASVPVIL